MSAHFDAIVIGGGLVGLSISYGLARAGLRVAVCDEGDQSGVASENGKNRTLSRLQRP